MGIQAVWKLRQKMKWQETVPGVVGNKLSAASVEHYVEEGMDVAV